jgi:hypothetical protein
MITRPYRAVTLGIMTIWAVLGVINGARALAGNRSAVSMNDRVQVGWEGFGSALGFALLMGLAISAFAVVGLWLGHQFQQWSDRRRAGAVRRGVSEPAA